jgi:hypothetical protein
MGQHAAISAATSNAISSPKIRLSAIPSAAAWNFFCGTSTFARRDESFACLFQQSVSNRRTHFITGNLPQRFCPFRSARFGQAEARQRQNCRTGCLRNDPHAKSD